MNSSIVSLGENLGELMEPNSTEITEPTVILNDPIGTRSVRPDASTSTALAIVPVSKIVPVSGVSKVEVFCNFCEKMVGTTLLCKHFLDHMRARPHFPTATRLRVVDVKSTVSTPTETFEPIVMEELKDFLNNHQPNAKLNDPTTFNFRRVRDISLISGGSTNKRYSDFTLVIWLEDGQVHGTGYYGYQSGFQKALERVSIHLVYDSLERYFTISAKGLKLYTYNNYDNEDHAVPNRICEQHELMRELKGVLLAYDLPPRAIYKRFRKIMNGPFLSEINDKKEPIASCSANHFSLLEALKNVGSVKQPEYDERDYMYGV
jgi:hypothetical protein